MPSASRIGNTISNHINRRIPRNAAALSRSIEIVTNNVAIGYIQKLTPKEGRSLWDCREIGNEEIVEITPGGPQGLSIDVDRVLLYTSRIQGIFDDMGGQQQGADIGRGVQSLMDYNYPFDIMVLMRVLPGGVTNEQAVISPDEGEDDANVKVTDYPGGSDTFTSSTIYGANANKAGSTIVLLDHFHECWFENVSYTVNAGPEFQIIESATVRYTWRTGSPLYTPPNIVGSNRTNPGRQAAGGL